MPDFVTYSFFQGIQWLMNACAARREDGNGLSFAWGFVSCTSLWSGSTDFHTHFETATKLQGERNRTRQRQEWKDVFLGGYPLYISPLFFFFFISVSLVCFLSPSFLSLLTN